MTTPLSFLHIGNQQVPLALQVANTFFSRLLGLLTRRVFSLSAQPLPALLFPRCRSVHTWGMRYAIDLLYLDAHGVVCACVPHLYPWHVSACRQAEAVLELPAGSIAKYGLVVGAVLQLGQATGAAPFTPHKKQAGAAMTEFIIVMPVLMLLGLAGLQFGLYYYTKLHLNYATFMAARAGSTHNANVAQIQDAFARAMVPWYGGGKTPAEIGNNLALAYQQTALWTRFEMINPRPESFEDWNDVTLQADPNVGAGKRVIPNRNLSDAPLYVVGPLSGQNLDDANLLKIRITFGYASPISLVTRTIQLVDAGLRAADGTGGLYGDTDPKLKQLLDNGRIPIVTYAVVNMQSEAIEPDSYQF